MQAPMNVFIHIENLNVSMPITDSPVSASELSAQLQALRTHIEEIAMSTEAEIRTEITETVAAVQSLSSLIVSQSAAITDLSLKLDAAIAAGAGASPAFLTEVKAALDAVQAQAAAVVAANPVAPVAVA